MCVINIYCGGTSIVRLIELKSKANILHHYCVGSMNTFGPITVINMLVRGKTGNALYYKVRLQTSGVLQHRECLVS